MLVFFVFVPSSLTKAEQNNDNDDKIDEDSIELIKLSPFGNIIVGRPGATHDILQCEVYLPIHWLNNTKCKRNVTKRILQSNALPLSYKCCAGQAPNVSRTRDHSKITIVEMRGVEPRTFRMQSGRAATVPHPRIIFGSKLTSWYFDKTVHSRRREGKMDGQKASDMYLRGYICIRNTFSHQAFKLHLNISRCVKYCYGGKRKAMISKWHCDELVLNFCPCGCGGIKIKVSYLALLLWLLGLSKEWSPKVNDYDNVTNTIITPYPLHMLYFVFCILYTGHLGKLTWSS